MNQLADNIEAGEKCFLHKKSFEIICWPDDYLFDYEVETDEAFEPWKKEIEKVKADPKNYLEIEKMSSSESYKVMEDFVESLPTARLREN